MRKLLLTCMLLLGLGATAWAANEYEVDEKFTTIDALDGQMFAIVDETPDTPTGMGIGVSGHGNDWDMYFGTITEAYNSNACYYKLEAVQTEGLEGYYYLRTYKNDATMYTAWGNTTNMGYFNSQTADKTVCFALGLNGQNGQDGENLAVWAIEVSEGKFALKNIGTGLYLHGDNLPAKYEDPYYFTFCTLKAGAEIPDPEPPIAEGKYYLYNVEAGGFVVGANNWGTRASISKTGGIEFEAVLANGKYELKTAPLYNGKHLGFNGYVDNGDANQNWTITPVEGQEGVFILSTNGTNVLFWDGGEATTTSVGKMPETAANAYWKIISSADRQAALETATVQTPVDATFLISNPNFSRDASTAAWTIVADNKNLSGGNNTNNCAESWRAAFTLSQELTLPNGVYALTAQAALTEYTVTGEDLPVVYANDVTTDVTTPFLAMLEGEDSMSKLSEQFSAGKYVVSPIFVEVTEGTLTIGVKGTRTDTWCIWDNFQLTYYGTDVTVLELKAAQAVEDYKSALAAAKAVDQNAKMNTNLKAQFVSDLDTYAEDKVLTNEATKESIETATAALNKITETVKANIAAYEATAQALETYAAKAQELDEAGKAAYVVTDIEAVYNNNTMEDDMTENVLVAFETAVKSQGVGADMTGAVRNADCTAAGNAYWTIEGGNTFHTNTWSNENDESGLKTPFIEDWCGGGNTLADATITHTTIEGLPAGRYAVSGFIRAFAENHADVTPSGACIFANGVDGEDISTGTAAVYNGNSGEVYGAYTVKCQVGEDGTLTFGIKVKDAVQYFDWIAFKNFTLTFEALTVTIDEKDNNTAKLEELDGCKADITLTRTLQTGSYNTFAVPFATAIPEGWTVKELTASEFNNATGLLSLTFGDALSIEAGKPYLVKVGDENVVNPTFNDVTIVDGTTMTQTTAVDFIPTLGKTLVTGPTGNESIAEAVLFLGANNTLLNPTVVNDPEQESSYMKGFRAYFQLKGDATQARAFSLDFGDGETTGIKAIDNGKLAIDNVVYDLQGRKVQNAAAKGMYIVNGKKVIIK